MWDRDLPSAPVLVTVTHEGRRVDAVAQTTKSGHVFLFNRETGVPLFPIEERAAPSSDLKGEAAWPTQPLPLKPPAFARQAFTEADVTDVSDASRTAVLAQLRKVRSGGQFVPPSTQGTVIFPGFDGGAEWGGAAFDESSGLLYVNSNEMPWILSMVEIDHTKESSDFARGRRTYQMNCTACHGVDRNGDPAKVFPSLVNLPKKMPRAEAEKIIAGGKAVMPAFPALSASERKELLSFLYNDKPVRSDDDDEPMAPGVPYTHTGYNRFLDPEGYPAVKPPWGTMNAIDLNAGTIAWQVPLGEEPALVARGRRHTGTENYGGPDHHGRRAHLHRRDEGREVPRARQAHRRRAVGDLIAGRRLRDAEHLHGQRQAVRRDCRRRGQDGHQVRRRVRRVRAAGLGRARCARAEGSALRAEGGALRAGARAFRRGKSGSLRSPRGVIQPRDKGAGLIRCQCPGSPL